MVLEKLLTEYKCTNICLSINSERNYNYTCMIDNCNLHMSVTISQPLINFKINLNKK